MGDGSVVPLVPACVVALALTVGLAGCAAKDPLSNLGASLPTTVGGWRLLAEDELYDTETIFSYIDGHAEVYLAYGMSACLARRYEGPDGEAAVVLDVFQMAGAADAYGVFTHDLAGDPVDVGQDGLIHSGWMRFWKGSFFVSVYAEDETPRARQTVTELARAVAAAIPEVGERPALVESLPAAGLAAGSVRYLRSHQILNGILYLGAEDVLGLGGELPAVVGEYHRGDDSARLLVVEYRNADDAERARRRFATVRAAAGPGDPPERTDDESCWAVATHGNRLVAVLDSSDHELASALLSEARAADVREGRTP